MTWYGVLQGRHINTGQLAAIKIMEVTEVRGPSACRRVYYDVYLKYSVFINIVSNPCHFRMKKKR